MSPDAGGFAQNGGDMKRLSFDEVAGAAYRILDRPADMEFGLDEDSFYQPTGLTYNFGTYIALVEVDPETGDVDLQKLFTVG